MGRGGVGPTGNERFQHCTHTCVSLPSTVHHKLCDVQLVDKLRELGHSHLNMLCYETTSGGLTAMHEATSGGSTAMHERASGGTTAARQHER